MLYILKFMSRIIFMLRWVEYWTSLIALGPGIVYAMVYNVFLEIQIQALRF